MVSHLLEQEIVRQGPQTGKSWQKHLAYEDHDDDDNACAVSARDASGIKSEKIVRWYVALFR
jgi:hypothetical protein